MDTEVGTGVGTEVATGEDTEVGAGVGTGVGTEEVLEKTVLRRLRREGNQRVASKQPISAEALTTSLVPTRWCWPCPGVPWVALALSCIPVELSET